MDNKPSEEELIKLSEKVISELKRLQASDKWQPNGEKPCKMFKMGVDSRIASKGIAIVNYPLQECIKFSQNDQNEFLTNTELKQFTTIAEVKQKCRVYYMRFKGMGPISDRDFVLIEGTKNQGNKYYTGTISTNYPHPQVKGVVRAECYIGGYIYEKIDEKSTRATYISDADIKGMIPGFVKNMVSQYQGQVASKIEGALTQSLKK